MAKKPTPKTRTLAQFKKQLKEAMKSYRPPTLEEMVAEGQRIKHIFGPIPKKKK